MKKTPDSQSFSLLNHFRRAKGVVALGEEVSVFIRYNLQSEAKTGSVAEDHLRSVLKTPGLNCLISDQHNINSLRVDLKVKSGKHKNEARPFDVLREYRFFISNQADYPKVFEALKDGLIEILRKHKLPGALINFRRQSIILKPSALKSR